MPSLMVVTLSVLSAALGVLCLYFAFLLTEPEERRAQELLERWWVVLDDVGNVTSRRAMNLAMAASRLVLGAINSVFTNNTISFRGVWTASCFSFAILLFGTVIQQATREPIGEGHHHAIYYAIFFFALGFFQIEKAPRGVQACGCGVLALAIGSFAASAVAYSVVIGGLVNAAPVLVELVLGAPAMLFGVALHLFWAAFLRWSITQYRAFESWYRTLVVTAVTCAILSVSILGPQEAAGRLLLWTVRHREHIILQMMVSLGLSGVSLIAVTAAWPLAAYFIAIIIHLLLRATWSLVPRFLYAAQRHRVLSNHAVLAKIGIGLLIASGITPLARLARLLAAHL